MINKQFQEGALYNKIQWLAEILYDEGHFKFYESCMLESIRNAVQKFLLMGVLEKKEVKTRKESYILIGLHDNYKDTSALLELGEKILFYLPYSGTMNMNKI